MRTAVLGLYFLRDPERLPAAVADVSRITHQDPRSVAGGIAIAKAAQLLANPEVLDERSFCRSVADAIRPYEGMFAALVEDIPSLLREERETALHAIAWAGSSKAEFSRPVITPFVIPTVLAALWAILRNPTSWTDAVCEAIHLGGDVDTLGAISGALAGVRLGGASIPAHLATQVLGSERIHALAGKYYEVVRLRGAEPES
jgi:ADP-ribosylglycohydrolase